MGSLNNINGFGRCFDKNGPSTRISLIFKINSIPFVLCEVYSDVEIKSGAIRYIIKRIDGKISNACPLVSPRIAKTGAYKFKLMVASISSELYGWWPAKGPCCVFTRSKSPPMPVILLHALQSPGIRRPSGSYIWAKEAGLLVKMLKIIQ